MELTRVSLPERIEAAQEGRTRQPEYLPCLVQQWAKTPIRAYFGPCKAELEQLLELLKLSPEDENLAYQDIAMRLFGLLNRDYIRGTAAMELLAVPVRTAWEQTKKQRDRHDQ